MMSWAWLVISRRRALPAKFHSSINKCNSLRSLARSRGPMIMERDTVGLDRVGLLITIEFSLGDLMARLRHSVGAPCRSRLFISWVLFPSLFFNLFEACP